MNSWWKLIGWICLGLGAVTLILAVLFAGALIGEYGQAVSWFTLVSQVAVVATPLVILFFFTGFRLLKSRS